ncbi:MAG: low molecular weight protein-tyrosine-phosphatase [Marinibacterium sp.]
MRILFVCLGNICRSPAAEAVARAKMPGHEFDSAGTSGWHVGDPPYGPMQAAGRVRGYDLSPLRARTFTAADFAAFDLIVGMDDQNVADIEDLRPEGASTPVYLFTDFGPAAQRGVPDPYYTRDFDGALDLIEACAEGLRDRADRGQPT